jgi:hypothetical protein
MVFAQASSEQALALGQQVLEPRGEQGLILTEVWVNEEGPAETWALSTSQPLGIGNEANPTQGTATKRTNAVTVKSDLENDASAGCTHEATPSSNGATWSM